MANRVAAARAFENKTPRVLQAVGLAGLPRTALPNDLLRLCGKSKVENVVHVALDYKRFKPTGTATLVFSRPEFIRPALTTLNQTALGGKTVKSYPISSLPDPNRVRGPQGLLEAAQRGIITGDGPDAGISGAGRNVLIHGLPGRTPDAMVSRELGSFKIVGLEQGRPVVIKLASDKQSVTSRFLVRLASVSEAYRLVRTLHMRKWRPEQFGDQFTIRAAVVS